MQLVAVMVLALMSAWMLRWFMTAPAGRVAKSLKTAGLLAVLAGGLFLIATPAKLAGLETVAAGAVIWLLRAIRLHGLARAFKGLFGGGAAAPDTSEVATRFLRMTLDHDSGALDGVVLEGRFQGRALNTLSLDEALELRDFVSPDPQSLRLVEAWLDRANPDWRKRSHRGGASAGAMGREEALEILGLAEGASAEDIKAAYKRLMRTAHPDAGGSHWLAARLNRARDTLLPHG
jgi:hypothetical protein